MQSDQFSQIAQIGQCARIAQKGKIAQMPQNEEITIYDPKMLASEFSTDSKQIRRFLRNSLNQDNHPGKGNRWQIALTAQNLEILRDRFNRWNQAKGAIISIDAFDAID
jgi:hypothetical protein